MLATARIMLRVSLLGLLPPAAAASAVAAPADDAVTAYATTVDAIIRLALTHGRAHERLVELTSVAPHRLSGSPGAEAAVAWGLRTMREDGLARVRAEPVVVPRWERGAPAHLRVTFAGGGTADLPVIALGGSIATPPDGVTAELVELRSLVEADERAAELSGRIAFYNRPMDASLTDTFAAYGGAVDQRGGGAIAAARHGALAAIVRSMTTRMDDVPHTGAMRYDDDVRRIPAAAVSTLGAERLSRGLAEGPVSARLFVGGRWLPDAESANVVGEIVGRERPEEVLLVGGHLDGWDVGQGAHDDGAGVVQSLEALRLLRELGLTPRRTIRCVLFMNEENGGAGSRAYREAHADELPHHVFALESDRGGFTPRGFTTSAEGDALRRIESVARLLSPIGADRVVPGSGGADVDGLRAHGTIVAGYLPDGARYFDVHHSDNDVLAAVNPRELELGAAAMAALLYVLADIEEGLPRPEPAASR